MNWTFREVKSGDIIRIQLGPIYHYGIYVSDEEIIQFGPPPVTLKRNDADIEVCVTDIESFLCGKMLEVADYDRKEKRSARNPQEVVAIARSRIGEKGYNILHNNCEHFVNECVFGEKQCSIVDRFKEMWRTMPLVDVYVAEYPFTCKSDNIFPKTRSDEINSCTHPDVKQQKHYVWKLLEYGLERSLGIDIAKAGLKPAPTGGWQCDKCNISLSHSNKAVAVVISRAAVGVDIESCNRDFTLKLAEKILTEKELSHYNSLDSDSKDEFLLAAWTQKEALFKKGNEKVFSPGKIQVVDKFFYTTGISLDSGNFLLSVATDTPDKVRLFLPYGGQEYDL
ncbi:MAG: 4'-phosphopantetheinyl transferase superfamily protein [Ruminococcaceae bacterium]|nr:4'-phosphopantetheinyl transferase superfamily protein [Oscillospiraceae bacterium]